MYMKIFMGLFLSLYTIVLSLLHLENRDMKTIKVLNMLGMQLKIKHEHKNINRRTILLKILGKVVFSKEMEMENKLSFSKIK